MGPASMTIQASRTVSANDEINGSTSQSPYLPEWEIHLLGLSSPASWLRGVKVLHGDSLISAFDEHRLQF